MGEPKYVVLKPLVSQQTVFPGPDQGHAQTRPWHLSFSLSNLSTEKLKIVDTVRPRSWQVCTRTHIHSAAMLLQQYPLQPFHGHATNTEQRLCYVDVIFLIVLLRPIVCLRDSARQYTGHSSASGRLSIHT